MPRNGSGQYTLPSGINPVITQTLITSNWANTTLNDVATALTQSLARDGQTLPTANLPMGGFRHTGAGDPQSAQDYMTLSFQQTGQATRLTNVSGINAITANLVGGATTFAVGQLVQLVPAVTNTGQVTLDINGGGPKAVLSAQGSQLGATNLTAGQVYLLSYNGTSWNILTSPDITAFAQSAISGWFRPGPSLPYPDVTQVNANTIAIPAGSGRIIAPSTRDITGVINVSWPAQNYVLQNIATQWETTIGINSSGQVVEFIGNVNSAWARTNIILCTVGHINGSIQFISNKPLIFGDVAYMAYDLGILFHNTLVKGGRVTGNVGNPIHIDIAAGTLWIVGGNADATDSPNLLPFAAISNANFWPVTTTLVGALTQNVPVANYDPGGAGPVVAIPGGGATSVVHRLYLLAGQLVFSYGQFTYASLDDAANNLARDDTAFTPPTKLVDATFVAWIVARKDATDLNNPAQARLINAGSAGGGGGGGGGSGIPDAPLTGQSFGRNNGVWVLVVDAVQAGSNITINAANPNKPIVNMPSGNIVAGTGISFGGTGVNRLVGAVGNLTVSAISQGDGDLVAGQGITLTGTLADRLVGAGNVTIVASDNPAASFKNKLINGNLDFWQRGIGFTANGALTADRWQLSFSGAAGQSVTRQPLTLGAPEQLETGGTYHAQVAGNIVGAGAFINLRQKLEGVRSFAGKNVTVSFYAAKTVGTNLGIRLTQIFGTGGAPSAAVNITPQKVVLTPAFAKYSVTFAVPSIAGKTLGTNGDDALILTFDKEMESVLAVSLGYAGGWAETGILSIAGVQMEEGVLATAFEIRPFGIELALCQRYYEKSYTVNVTPGTVTAAGIAQQNVSGLPSAIYSTILTAQFKIEKRAVPTMTWYSPTTGTINMLRSFASNVDVAATSPNVGLTCSQILGSSGVASTSTNLGGQWTADAEL